jgi:hypothetical protein
MMATSLSRLRLWFAGAILFCFAILQIASTADARSLQGENKAATVNTASAEAHPAAAHSSEAHPVLVELFTSEGCSSCPPADLFVQKLDADQPVAGVQLIVLSEHVDYWDHDGWKDPNSSASLTDRQSSYERAFGLKTPYTPQIIVDGTSVVRMGEAQQAEDIFQKAKVTPKIPVRIDDVKVDTGTPSVLRARIETDASFDRRNADVYVAVAVERVESQVLRGENSGRHLIHVAVVQELTKVGKLRKGKSFDQAVQLELKPGLDPKNLRLVAFVQEPGPGRVLGAALRKPVL